jgi:hypothetical protein
MGYVLFSEETAIIFLNCVNRFVFILEKVCIFFKNWIFKYHLDGIRFQRVEVNLLLIALLPLQAAIKRI